MAEVKVEKLNFFTRDHVQLAAELYTPREMQEGYHFPAILLCQGLSGNKSIVLPSIAKAFAQAGFMTLTFDYQGFGESSGTKGWIDLAQRTENAMHALAFLKTLQNVDKDRIGIYGLSLGGGIALSLAAQDPSIKAVVMVSGFASGKQLLRNLRTPEEWIAFKERVSTDRQRIALTGESEMVSINEIIPFTETFNKKYQALKGKDSTSKPSFALASADLLLRFNLNESLEDVSPIPVLILHGEMDDLIPVEDALKIYNHLKEPKKIVTFKNYDHIDLDSGPGLDSQIHISLEWFSEYL